MEARFIEVLDSKQVKLTLWQVGKVPLVFFVCSLIFFLCALMFFPIVFDVFLYINTVFIIISIFYMVMLGVVPMFFKREPNENFSPEMVSIVIPVFNDGEVLEKNLDNLVKLSYPNLEIIIVYSKKSTDTTEEVALAFAEKYEHIHAFPENVSRGYAVNLGVDKANYDFILFLDSDSFIFDGFIERMLSYFSEEEVKFVSSCFLGRNTTQNKVTLIGWAMLSNMNFYGAGTNKYVKDINFGGFGGMWRKSSLIECGKFDEDALNQDQEINYRILTKFPDWKGIYDENLFCYQYYMSSLRALYTQQLQWTVAKYRYTLGAVRKMSGVGVGKKFIFLSSFIMIVIVPLMVWVSMGMSFIQFFLNFFRPNLSFGGGLFFFILGIISYILTFTALFSFIYPKYRGKSRVVLSRKLLLGGIFVMMFIAGFIFGIVAINGLKELVGESKEKKTFIKMDKSNVIDDEMTSK